MMRDLIRATLQLACAFAIYTAERVLEQLDAERPMHDDPLPGPIDDFSGYATLPGSTFTPSEPWDGP